MRTNLIAILFLFGGSHISISQKLLNINAVADGNRVAVNYDLVSNDPSQKFTIQLFSSDNNYRIPLTLVSGDVGKDIAAGKSKKIIWNAAGELKRFSGNISFEIRATIVSAKANLTNPLSGTTFRRGRTYEIKWQGGDAAPKYDIELYRNDVKLKGIGKSGGKRSFTWLVPESSKPGGDYEIRLVNNLREEKGRQRLKIGRKIPLVLKIAPVLVVGGVIAAISGGTSSSSSAEPLPEPPGSPDGN